MHLFLNCCVGIWSLTLIIENILKELEKLAFSYIVTNFLLFVCMFVHISLCKKRFMSPILLLFSLFPYVDDISVQILEHAI